MYIVGDSIFHFIFIHFFLKMEEMESRDIAGLVLSGGPASVNAPNAPRISKSILALGFPILGICYGLQWITVARGGRVAAFDGNREFGRALVRRTPAAHSDILSAVPDEFLVFQSHNDAVDAAALPPGFHVLATSGDSPVATVFPHVAVVAHESERLFGLQFHPEVDHSEHGRTILANFAIKICAAPQDWRLDLQYDRMVEKTRAAVGPTARVLLGISGGVDSTTLAVFLQRVLGDRCVPVFIDNGLLRRNEAAEVEQSLRELGLANLQFHDCSARFLNKLSGVVDADQRRKIIGHEFVAAFEEIASKLVDVQFLAQGTLYPDVIESGSGGAAIKRHHNVGGLPEKMNLRILEPFRALFKDEVRRIALDTFNMPRALVFRHPFPGPALAVRIVGAPITPERLEMLRNADAIFLAELHRANVYYEISQAFAALICIETVGVQGDAHSAEAMVMLRAVVTQDFMSADVFELDHALLRRVATRIVNETRGVNRVAFDVTQKPPATIEYL